jgi:hypothetical protein
MYSIFVWYGTVPPPTVGVRPLYTGIGKDPLYRYRRELHVEERVRITKALGYTTHT